MRKVFAVMAGATALLVAAACTDSPLNPTRIAPNAKPAFTQVNGAAFTSVNPGVLGDPADASDLCKNGSPLTNCNIYTDKHWVWLNGGPAAAGVGGDGDYFFAVLAPGGQGGNDNPNDCTAANLSDYDPCPSTHTGAGDTWRNRVFHVSGSTITYPAATYPGGHDFDPASGKIRVFPYDDTPNHGGVYILAVCKVPSTIAETNPPGAVPSDCKYDAFKVLEEGETPGAEVLTVSKTGTGAYTKTYAWTIAKDASPTHTEQIGGTVHITYNVTIDRDEANDAISDVTVSGKITVSNPNPVNVQHVTVTDQLDGTDCTVTSGSDVTIGPGDTDFDYSCSLTAVPTTDITNTATAAWLTQTLSGGLGELTGGSAHFDLVIHPADFTETPVNATVNVTDAFNGGSDVPIGTLLSPTGVSTVTLAEAPKTFTYYRDVAVPAHDCVTYPNTATITETGQTADAEVEVCGPANTGALTIGFWKGPNGNSLIQNYCADGSTHLDAYLHGLGAGSGPFSDALGKSCSQLVTYVNGILTGASATNMNSMLRAQMLGTALDVYFSTPGFGYSTTAKGGTGKTQIKPPSNFLQGNSLGTFNMDVTAVCPMVDNLSTGTATCQGGHPSTDAVLAGALPTSPMAIQAILDYAATTPNPFNGSTSSPNWYGGDRTKQEILKNVFDQFNNGLAFGSF